MAQACNHTHKNITIFTYYSRQEEAFETAPELLSLVQGGGLMHIFKKGNRVSQPQCGAGTIVQADDRHTVVDFDDYGLRTFSTPLVTLVHSDSGADEQRALALETRAEQASRRNPGEIRWPITEN